MIGLHTLQITAVTFNLPFGFTLMAASHNVTGWPTYTAITPCNLINA